MLAHPERASAVRPILLEHACAADAEMLLARLSGRHGPSGTFLSKAIQRPRFVLAGGPFSQPAIELGPLSLFEVGRASIKKRWLRGGYPESFCTTADEEAFTWLEGYAADLAYGALGAWGLPREPALIAGLLQAIAANNGKAFNANAEARALGVSRPTIVRYIDMLKRAGIVMSVPAIGEAGLAGIRHGARVVKSNALYIRDSGLLHTLLGIHSADELTQRPGAAARSWTGFVVGQALGLVPPGASLHRFASADGAELDLVVIRNGVPIMLAAARRHRPVSVERSISYAAKALAGDCQARFIVVPDEGERALPGGFVAIGAGTFLDEFASVTA
ncbi:hypothetical protein MASR2M48_17160 [Spirochaetota bacterium]